MRFFPHGFWNKPTSAPAFNWTTNLVAHWKLNEASGTRNDSHGTNHLTATNNPVGVAGKIGDACQFVRASSQRLSVASNANLLTGDVNYFIAFWLRLNSVTNSPYPLTKATGGSQEWCFVYDLGTGEIVLHLTPSTVQARAAMPNNNSWHLVMGWHDATNNLVGIQVDDGLPVTNAAAPGSATGNATNPVNFGILNSGATTTLLNGAIDSVSFWKGRLLNGIERKQLWNNGNGRDYLA